MYYYLNVLLRWCPFYVTIRRCITFPVKTDIHCRLQWSSDGGPAQRSNKILPIFNKITRSEHLQFSNLKAPFAYPFGHLPNLELKEKWKKKKIMHLDLKPSFIFWVPTRKTLKQLLYITTTCGITSIIMVQPLSCIHIYKDTCGCM